MHIAVGDDDEERQKVPQVIIDNTRRREKAENCRVAPSQVGINLSPRPSITAYLKQAMAVTCPT